MVIFPFQLEVPLNFGINFRWCLNYWSEFALQLACVLSMSEMVSQTNYFNHISRDNYMYVAASFRSTEQCVVLDARNHRVRPNETKLGIVHKNIQQWLKNFSNSDFEQVPLNRWHVQSTRGSANYCNGINAHFFLPSTFHLECNPWTLSPLWIRGGEVPPPFPPPHKFTLVRDGP